MSPLKSLLKNKFQIKYLRAQQDVIDELKKCYSALHKFKKIKVKGRPANEFNKATIKELRDKIKATETGLCVLYHKGKQFETYITIDSYPGFTLKPKEKKQLFIDAYNQYVQNIQTSKAKERTIKEDDRAELGFKYKMSGGVFNKTGQVLALQSVESQMQRIKIAKAPSKENKRNYIGVELEIVCRLTREQLEKKFCESYLGGYVYIKNDGSIQVEKTGEVAHEVTILAPESMYENVIERVCKVLNDKAVGTYVNNSCGLHVHFDARNRDINKMFANMMCVLPLASKMVPKNRITSAHSERYCKMNKHKLFEEQAKLRDRYTAINAESFKSHNTVEVRLHSGTTNSIKIRAWVKTFLNAINHEAELKDDINTVSRYAATFGVDSKLNEYMIKRIALFEEKGEAIDTRADHHLYNEVVAI